MSRTLALAVLAAAVAFVRADDPPKKLTPAERKELTAKFHEAFAAVSKEYQAGRLPEAVKLCEQALALARELYPPAEFPDGTGNLAAVAAELGLLYRDQGKLAQAEPLLRESLAVYRKLYKGDRTEVSTGLLNLGMVCVERGKLAEGEPLVRESLAMSRRLFKGQDHPQVAGTLNGLGALCWQQGKLGEAEPLLREALDMYRRLLKGQDHPEVAAIATNLAALSKDRGKATEAERLFRDALAMHQRLFKGQDHPAVATSMNNLALLFSDLGRLDAAEPLFRDALAMRRRLFKDQDHPAVATSMNNLALLYRDQDRHADAEPLMRDALAMRKRLFKGDHPAVAQSMNNLAHASEARGKPEESEALLADALAMYRRLYKGDHPEIANGLNNLALRHQDRGQFADAERLLAESLAMYRRMSPGDHPRVAGGLNNLGGLYRAQGRFAAAEPLIRDSLAMRQRLTAAFARERSEGEALNFVLTQPLTRDAYLSVAGLRGRADPAFDPAAAYPTVWAAKGAVARVYEQRQLTARAAAADPASAKELGELAEARRRRAERLLARAAADPGTAQAREADLKALDDRIAELTARTAAAFPPVARVERLGAATAADLQKALPPGAALVDYVRYTAFRWDEARPAGQRDTATPRYLAFVVTRDKVTWVDLGEAARVEPVAAAWRGAVASGKPVPADLPDKARALVWEPVRKALPAGTAVVYLCPDAALCGLPFAALPGDKAGTVVLEDFALATVPHAPFLLDKLWPQDKPTSAADRALVVGGVRYDAAVPPADPAPRPGDPLVRPDRAPAWAFLKGTADERDRVVRAATARKLPVTALDGEGATTAAVLDALPKARVAHLATHGFFADPSFRGLFQLDDRDFRTSPTGERVGRAANSPLVMTGLVLAGANGPKTPGRGILTGEQLIDRDLSGLELAVLSACETGVGDPGAGGEGVFALQRAFHYAGARDVVASLWKVEDAATAALMGRFYAYLWDKGLPPVEALRQAQLAVYRADPKDFPAMAQRGIGAGTKDLDNVPLAPAVKGGTHPALWAAFTLSGPGR